MGGGGSSKETTNKTVNQTTTTTTVRDIGFTGQQAVDFAGLLQSGAIESERLRLDSVSEILDTGGDALQDITQTQRRQTELANNTIGVLAARAVGDEPKDEDDEGRLEKLAVLFGGAAVLITILKT